MRRLDGGNRSDAQFLPPGARYGKWTVIQDATVRRHRQRQMKTRVRCDCGATSVVRNTKLLAGKSKSCVTCSRRGPPRKPILSGTRFGRWTVIQESSVRRHRQTYSQVKCDCGRNFVVNNGSLRAGASRSCRFCARGSKTDWRGIKARAEGER